MAKEKKARHKFQMSSAKDNMLPQRGSAHTRIVAVSGNLRRVRETPRVMRVAGEAVVEATTSDYGCFGGMLDGVSPADLDETASQYIDPELVRRKRYTASVRVYDCTRLGMLKASQDMPMLEWRPYRTEYLMESMRREGRGEAASWERCPTCGQEEPVIYSCVECFGGLLECQACFVNRHKRLPLHTVKVSYSTEKSRRC